MFVRSFQKDFLVISSDLVTDVQIPYLADIHRTHDATVTCLLMRDQKVETKF